MISCKNVAKLPMSDELSAQSWWRRMEVRLHLSMCDLCSRLARQIKQLRSAARQMRDWEEPDDPELEHRLIRRLSGRK
jgi:hypothetical protein